MASKPSPRAWACGERQRAACFCILSHSIAAPGPGLLPTYLAATALPAHSTCLPFTRSCSNIAFLGSGLLVANYVGAIAAALRFPALFNIWTMGAGHAVLAVRRRGAGCVGGGGACEGEFTSGVTCSVHYAGWDFWRLRRGYSTAASCPQRATSQPLNHMQPPSTAPTGGADLQDHQAGCGALQPAGHQGLLWRHLVRLQRFCAAKI